MPLVKRRDSGTYREAMALCPRARQFELRKPVELATPRTGEVIVDFPSAGSYFQPYLDEICPTATIRAVEHVRDYIDANDTILGGTWERLPFADQSVDVVITLAAIHHVLSGREAFYRECHRILRPGGRLIIGDVEAGSPPDSFLNDFVDRFSSQGHEAEFLNRQTEEPRLVAAGFSIVHYDAPAYAWSFPNKATTIRFCGDLFRLDEATDDEIWQGVSDYLGVEDRTDEVRLNWQLAFVRANRQERP